MPEIVTMLTDWVASISTAVWWLLASSSVLFILLGIVLIPWLVIQIPTNYFVQDRRSPLHVESPYPKLNFLLTLAKNLAGSVFILAGIAMLVLPGQGLLTILVGLMLTNFPGKFKLERRLIQQRHIYQTLNWIRRKAHRPPITAPPKKGAT